MKRKVRTPFAFGRVHALEDSIRPRFEKAVGIALAKFAERLPDSALERALTRRGAAAELIDSLPLEDALTPAAQILTDAVLAGGKKVDE